MSASRRGSSSRRSFLKTLPAAVAATVAASALAPSQTPATTDAVTSDALAVAQQIVGVELPAAERETARVLVARNRDNIEQLRRVAIQQYRAGVQLSSTATADHKHKRAPDYGQVALAEQREILGRAGISSDIARAAGVRAGHPPLVAFEFAADFAYRVDVDVLDATQALRSHACFASSQCWKNTRLLKPRRSTGELAVGDLWFRGRTKNPWNTDVC